MTDIFGIETGASAAANRICRVSYTLNNEQPVTSTIIGEQPLFYMDYDVDFEDEDIFDAADAKILEQELMNLQGEIKSLYKFSEDFTHSPEERFDRFLEGKESFMSAPSKGASDVDALKAILGQSRLATGYLECADAHNIEIKFTNQVDDAFYDRKFNDP